MNAVSHPDKQILADYATGKLAEDEASTVARHLTECPECESTIQALEARSETLVSGLGDKAPSEPYAGETELRRAVEKVAKNPTGAKPQAAADKVSTKGPVKLGPYQLLAKLGEGGMGAVFKARHEHLDKIVAIKVLPKKAMADPAAVARFRREMKAVGALHHPNIVGAHDAGEAQGVHFLVMEYVAGSDLSSLIKKSGPVTVEQAVSYMAQAAKGLAFAHAKNIVHRDIKPANLLVDGEGTVKILDMGLARLDDGGAANAEANQGLTQTGQVMGTVDYMAPEQAFDTHRADAKADVYSLGCTLYRILTGENAFRGDTVVQKILAHREQPIPSLVKLCLQAPAALDALYQRMLAKTPDGRPTMAEVVKELDALAANPQATESSGPAIAIDTSKKSPVSREAKPSAKPQAKRDAGRGKKPPVKLIAAGLGGFAIISLGVLLYFGDTEVEVPDGATAKIDVDAAGKPQVRITMPSAAPTPAVAKPVPTSSKPPVSFFGDHASTSISKPTEFQGNRYQVFKDVVDWKQAKQRCESQGGHLAVVRSAEEQAFLVALLKSAGMDAAWIGATDAKKEGDWVWVDGTKVTFADWDKSQPNNKPPGEHYAAIVLNFQGTWLNGRWSDQPAVAAQHPTIGYVCQWDAPPFAPESQWSAPENLGPIVNTTERESFPALSGDGLMLVFTNSRTTNAGGTADLWSTRRATTAAPWEPPVKLGSTINTTKQENTPCLSADGLTLMFMSDRPGGVGDDDLWQSTRLSTNDPWSPAVNLGPVVNSAAGDDSPFLSRDGLTLWFASNRPGGAGGYDIWQAMRPAPNDPFGPPVNLGPPVNTAADEADPAVSPDGRELLISVRPPTSPKTAWDLKIASRSGDGWSAPRPLTPLNSPHEEFGGEFTPDGAGIILHSRRPGGQGADDLWYSRRTSLPPTFTNPLGMEFVRVPQGKSWLGGGAGRPGTRAIEYAEDFYLGKFEVTQAQWQVVTGTNPSYYTAARKLSWMKDVPAADYDRFPVDQVSWDDCQDFLAKLNERTKETGWTYRLPTRDEWEYALRGGPQSSPAATAFDFYFAQPTNTLAADMANFDATQLKRPVPVGSYPPNALGSHDLHGNVSEWCHENVIGPDGAAHHPFVGGNAEMTADVCRALTLRSHLPTYQAATLGLRIVRVRTSNDKVAVPYTLTPYELLTSPDYEWSEPVKVSDMAKLPAVSGDGLSLVSVAGAAAPVGGNDLFIAERKTLDIPFGANANLGPTINSEAHDSYPWLSADGLTLIFSSERSGGVGNNDLWTTTRPARGEPFGPPTPFEPPVNTVNQETGGALSADGRTLVFASTRGSATGAGDSDLWQCRRKDSQSPFEKPESLGPGVNSPLAELRPWLSADGRVLCFGSAELTKDSAGRNAHVLGSHQIWFAVRPSVDAPFGERQPLGPPIAVPGSVRTSPSLSADGTLLFFESKRTDADHELWMSRRVPKSANAKGIVRPQISVDPDRTFAEWALAGKAQVVVVRKDDKSNKDIYARVPEELPAEPFWVVQFGVNPAWTPSTERKRFTDETVERLTGLKLLRRVEYYDAGLTDAGVARLATVTTLTSVTARDMKLTDDAFLPLLELPNVESISTTGVQITDRLLEAAAKKPSLKRLGVTTCDQLTDAGLEALVAKNDWERLDIGSPYFRPYKFTDAGLLKLAALKSLQVLNIQGLGKRSTFEALHKALPDCDIYWRLYELNFHVGKVPTKTCSLRVVLAKTGQELTITADQRAPSGLADSDLTRIVEINMTDDREFSGPNVGWLLSELTDVEVLVVDGTGVTDKELPAIEAMSGLKQVSLKRTKVTAAGVTKLQQALPKCTISWDGALQKTAAARQITTLDDPAYQAWLKAAQALPAEQQLDAVSKKLMELNAGFDGKLVGYGTSWTDIPPKIEKGAVLDVGLFTDQIEDLAPLQVFSNARRVLCCGSNPGKGRLVDLSPLAGLPLTNLSCANNPISDLTPLADMPLKGLICNGTAISDIAPLAGLPLIEVRLHSTSVSDLTPLKGMKLSILYCYDTPVSDLAPLAGMPLTALNCSETPVSDLTPLKGMSLTYLWLHDTPVSDLTPLAGMPLKSLRFTPANVSRGIETIRAMTTVADLGLKHQAVGGGVYTPAEFWKKYDAGEFASPNAAATPAWQSPEFEQWIKSVRAVPADKQLDAVSKKLMERNPGFDGVLTSADGKGPPKIENGVVTEVRFLTDNVADIAPVRALAGLKALNCSGSGKPQAGNGLLADLAPLTGLALTSLEFNDTKAADLSPLAGMPLVRLSCFHTRVGDLKPLQGMKLTYISFHGSSRVTDLSPLRGMPLTFLSATHTNLTDVTPLASCPTLISVNLSSTKVSAEAVDALQQALPKCKIYWSARTSGNGVD